MFSFPFKNVFIESYAIEEAPFLVSSAELEDRIAPLYERLKVPFGTLEKLSGIKTRRYWHKDVAPSVGAIGAGKQALESIGFDRSRIGAVINCSVTRDYFEPSTSCIVHNSLGMPESTLAFDITNACIGFSNGIQVLGNMIESGLVGAGLLVSGENIACVVETTIDLMLERDDLTREELLKLLPSFTLGCGGVAMVLCHRDLATKGHRVMGGVSRSASQFESLCKGNGDFAILHNNCRPVMYTESNQLMEEAAKLGGRTWPEFSEVVGWEREELDHIFCHQVGRQVNEGFYREMTLDMSKEFTIYQRYGNMVSAALPSALVIGAEEKPISSGEKVLLTAYGSGLNCIFLGIEW